MLLTGLHPQKAAPSHLRSFRMPGLLSSLGCALALPLCLAFTRPLAEIGINDDWSYAWSAQQLALTGHIIYNGWATAMLGWQLLWGALFIKTLGFSFFTLRLATLLLSMMCVALLQRIFVRCGLSERFSVFATLTLALSPLFLPLAFSFMSDVPGWLALLVCLYGCLRALESSGSGRAIAWLAAASLLNAAGGSARQVAWLGALVMVPCTAWLLRRRAHVLPAASAIWALSALLVFAIMHWYAQQPYALVEKTFARPHDPASLVAAGVAIAKNILAAGLFLLPVLVAMLWRYPWRERMLRRAGLLATGFAGVAVLALAIRHRPLYWLAPFSDPYVTPQGIFTLPVLLGTRPDVLSPGLRAVLTLLTLAGLFAAVAIGLRAGALPALPGPRTAFRISDASLAILLGPYTLTYCLLIATRNMITDRYVLPMLAVALIFLLRLYQQKLAPALPAISFAMLALFTAFAIAGTHDLFAFERARIAAADRLLAAGIPRTRIHVGFEYDGWTELMQTGYMNDSRMHLPANLYKSHTVPAEIPPACQFYLASHIPSIAWHDAYGLATSETPCFPASSFATIPFTTWLAPHHQAILIRRLP